MSMYIFKEWGIVCVLIGLSCRRCLPPRGARPGQVCTRQVKFFAPTGVGLYEFRVFDGEYCSPEDGEEEIEPDVIGRGALLRVDVSVPTVLNYSLPSVDSLLLLLSFISML